MLVWIDANEQNFGLSLTLTYAFNYYLSYYSFFLIWNELTETPGKAAARNALSERNANPDEGADDVNSVNVQVTVKVGWFIQRSQVSTNQVLGDAVEFLLKVVLTLNVARLVIIKIRASWNGFEMQWIDLKILVRRSLLLYPVCQCWDLHSDHSCFSIHGARRQIFHTPCLERGWMLIHLFRSFLIHIFREGIQLLLYRNTKLATKFTD